jgi:hypothetical protein
MLLWPTSSPQMITMFGFLVAMILSSVVGCEVTIHIGQVEPRTTAMWLRVTWSLPD